MVAIIAVAGGFLGSVLHDLITPKLTTVRAERFEVVEPSGRVLSYWGPDADRNIPPATPRGTLLVFLDSHAVRRLQLGAVAGNYSPHLESSMTRTVRQTHPNTMTLNLDSVSG